MIIDSVRILLVSTVTLLACSCTTIDRPDLKRLYAMQEGTAQQPPVILIHGLLGGRLADANGREVFPGSFLKLAFSNFADLRLPIDPDELQPLDDGLRASGITDKAAGLDFYGRIIEVLEEAGGFQPGKPGVPATSGAKRYYVFFYDWRQDNVVTAQRLDAFIEQIRQDHGDSQLKFDVIAHSMGGLIVRYFARYGTRDVLDGNDFPVSNEGARKLRRVVLLGTPNLGAAQPLHGFINGVRVGLGKVPTEVAVTFPSSYQLFPHALTDWLVLPDGRPLERDLFDVEIWRRFEFSVFDPRVESRVVRSFDDPREGQAYLETLQRYFEKHLERARRFVWSLTVEADPPVRYVVLGGDCHLTPARLLVEEVNGVSEIRLRPREVRNRVPGVDYKRLMLEPGDGTVTKASLLARLKLDPTVARHQYISFPLDYAFFLCESHTALTGNISFQDNLLHLILSVDLE